MVVISTCVWSSRFLQQPPAISPVENWSKSEMAIFQQLTMTRYDSRVKKDELPFIAGRITSGPKNGLRTGLLDAIAPQRYFIPTRW